MASPFLTLNLLGNLSLVPHPGAQELRQADVLGVSPSSGYELMREPDFPALKIGSRIVVPKEKFIAWVERSTGGAS